MSTTMFLSLWMNNSSTAVMMIPLAKSVATEYCNQLSPKEPSEKQEIQTNGDVIVNMQLQEDNAETVNESHVEEKAIDFVKEEEFGELSQEKRNVLKVFVLSVPWCCNLGGAGSLYGSGTNLLLKANLESAFEDPMTITFVNWAAFSLPCSLIMLVFGWALLLVFHLGWRSLFVCRRKTPQLLQREANLRSIFLIQYKNLGPMSFAEYAAVGHMAVLVLAWITMDPGFVSGWSSLISKGFSSPYTPAFLVTISTFIFPSKFPNFLRFWDKNKMAVPHTPAPPLMDWKTLNKLLPWSTLLLIGGGMSLAEGIKLSGLSVWISGNLTSLKDTPSYAIAMISVTFATFCTEFMSASALISIIHPILASLAVRLNINPLYFMFPASVGGKYSFMLPTASSTNAISYSAGVLTIPDMLKPGIIMNVMGILVITLAANTWGSALFSLDTFPPWAGGNTTAYNASALT